ncbi:MAG: hypothetical protein A2073_08195 [Deltaproteobacteria bacterium GWC2_42_11]|nr:MAG: hypothetical protein A2073_08195 [Deltaproteobacteria bacterium GWC2_42_11]
MFNSIPAVYGRNRTAPLIYSNYAESIGEAFEGEKLIYNIGFWLFEKAAIGRMSLKKNENGGYTAVLEAETLGVIGWVTRYRKDTYITHMNETPDGRRFITSVFDKTITIGTKTKRTVTNLDYKKGLMKWKRWTGDKQEEDREEEIPPDTIYDDPLAAFYNFRFGTYGQIEEGREYHIPTFPKKGIKTMYVRIAKAEEKNKRIHSDPDDVDYLADIIIDKELFGSQTGKIEAFFTKEMIPMGGIVKDLIFFGDVRGTLIEMSSRVALKRDLPL